MRRGAGELTVALAATDRPWADRAVEWITAHAEGVRLRGHYVVGSEAALVDQYDCLVVDADSTLADPVVIGKLHRRGTAVVGVCQAGLSHTRDRLKQAGCDAVVEEEAGAAALLEAVTAAARSRRAGGDLDAELEEVLEAGLVPAGQAGGWCLTVVTGAVEDLTAVEVAVEVAAALAARPEPTVLVDLDLTHPVLAQRLQVPVVPNVLSAIEAMRGADRPVGELLATPAGGGFQVLAGVDHPHYWAALDAGAAGDLLAVLGQPGRQVVAVVGSALEEVGAGRNGVARRTLAAADRVVVTAPGHPLGVRCLSQWAVEATEVADLARVFVALTGAGAQEVTELEPEIRRLWQPAGICGLPEDRRLRQAVWACQLARRSRWTRAVAGLAELAVPALTRTAGPAWAARRQTA